MTKTIIFGINGTVGEYGVYLASLSDYNAGHLVGKWYDLEEEWSSFDEIVSDFYSVMAELTQRDGKRREEWEIHDTSGFCSELWRDEINFFLEASRQDEPLDAVVAWIHRGYELLVERFQESFQGKYDSLREFVEVFLDDTGLLNQIPESLRYYFDYESYARDLEYSGEVDYVDGFVFFCR